MFRLSENSLLFSKLNSKNLRFKIPHNCSLSKSEANERFVSASRPPPPPPARDSHGELSREKSRRRDARRDPLRASTLSARRLRAPSSTARRVASRSVEACVREGLGQYASGRRADRTRTVCSGQLLADSSRREAASSRSPAESVGHATLGLSRSLSKDRGIPPPRTRRPPSRRQDARTLAIASRVDPRSDERALLAAIARVENVNADIVDIVNAVETTNAGKKERDREGERERGTLCAP